jgi:hypothetical protein
VEYLLIIIGITLLSLSVILLLIGSFHTRKETKGQQRVETYKKEKGELLLIPFRLPCDSKIKGDLFVRTGEIEISLQDYFGWLPQPPIDWVTIPSHKLWVGHGQHFFEVDLTSGDYAFLLGSVTPKTRATFDWRITHYIKPLEQLKDLGLVFIEISVPLLVTGIVI